MSTTMRGILRGVATGVGAVALLWSAAACTGAEEQPPDGGSAPTSATEPDEGATDTGSPTYSPAGQSPYGEEDLQTASQRFVDLLHVLDDQDWEAACGMVLDPTTGTAPEGERRQECAAGAESAIGEHAEQLEPGAFDTIDASMVEAHDNGDGTVSLSVLGEELDVPMAPGEDGRWYLVIPF